MKFKNESKRYAWMVELKLNFVIKPQLFKLKYFMIFCALWQDAVFVDEVSKWEHENVFHKTVLKIPNIFLLIYTFRSGAKI